MLLIKPTFNRMTQMLTIPSGSLNAYAETEIQDNFGFYQSTFGVFGYMKLNSKLKFILHNLRGIPMLWQPNKSCSWDPLAGMYTGKTELTPCDAKINAEYCIDEMFDGCFKHLMRWNGSGPLTIAPEGEELFNMMVRTLSQNAVLGARITLTVGKLYDPSTVAFGEKVPYEVRNLFTKTIGTCRGWVELLKEMGTNTDYSHLNVPGLFTAGMFDGKKYTGDPLVLYDALREQAPYPLQTLINEGGLATSMDGSAQPLFLVSTSVYNAVADAWRALCVSVTCTNPRLTRRDQTVTTSRGPRVQHVYYIDDTPVVPLAELGQVDQYLTGTLHFASIVAAGNITLGGSFASIDELDAVNGNAGIAIQRETNLRELGKYYFSANHLFATNIADTDYIVATQAYVVPTV